MTLHEKKPAMSALNVRARGKIRRDEWPEIVGRFKKGETLAAIARSYRCTAPAIRYIVAQTARKATAAVPKHAVSETSAQVVRRLAEAGRPSDENSPVTRPSPNSTREDIWSRINTDVATFLAAIDELLVAESDDAYEGLLLATDRLLMACARTRLELDKIIASRRGDTLRRRVSG